jgi:hypothetical protein
MTNLSKPLINRIELVLYGFLETVEIVTWVREEGLNGISLPGFKISSRDFKVNTSDEAMIMFYTTVMKQATGCVAAQ